MFYRQKTNKTQTTFLTQLGYSQVGHNTSCLTYGTIINVFLADGVRDLLADTVQVPSNFIESCSLPGDMLMEKAFA